MAPKKNDVLNSSIYWQKHATSEKFFFAYSDGALLLLRLNNFPDEPLYTLIIGIEIEDLEEIPNNWIVSY